MKEKIIEILENFDRKDALKILSEILDEEYDLRTASNLVKSDCEPDLTKEIFDDNFYNEGNEDAGYIPLKKLINSVTETINCDIDSDFGDINFTCFVRLETEEEKNERSHNDGIAWWTGDENTKIENLNIQFEL